MKRIVSLLLIVIFLSYISCSSKKEDNQTTKEYEQTETNEFTSLKEKENEVTKDQKKAETTKPVSSKEKENQTIKKQTQTEKAKSIVNLNSDNFEEVIKNDIVVIEFWTERCENYKEMEQILEKLSYEIPDITFAKINVDENSTLINKLRLRIRDDVPTLIIFTEGIPVDGFVGIKPEEIIKEKIVAAKKNKETMDAFESGKINFIEAFDFTLPDLKGKKTTLSKIKGLIILDFWATWCGPCKAEIPYLQQFYDEYKDRGLTIVGVSSETQDKIKKFKNDMENKGTKISYIILVDQTREVSSKFGIRSIPTTYFIAPNGSLISKETGFAPQYADKFKKIIEENLPKQK
ncbi:MAG: redoxin domain-containing protein [Candidatus Cloacimonetes bacterium]|nr:redoxin domain-containing protein [Candidatus Cloacimonadota bacterium]